MAINYANTRTGMQKTKAPVTQNIPFVAGKSSNKSHNIGIRIQQTKSLMINMQLNRKPKPKQKLSLENLEDDCCKAQSSITSSTRYRNEDICPVLKHQSRIKPKLYINESSDEETDKTKKEKKSIEEIWADYMLQVESKTIVPVKCTCFPSKYKNSTHKKDRSASVRSGVCKTGKKRKNYPSTIYFEARKIMQDCREVLNESEEEIASTADTMSTEDFNKKPTRSTKMARYMQRIKHFQDRLMG